MNDKSYWSKWFKAAGIRAVRTMAQTAIATIPVQVAITDVEWIHVVGVAALAGVLSLLTSIAGLPELESEGHGDDTE